MSMKRYNTNYYGKETDKDIGMVEKVGDAGLRVPLLPNGAAHVFSLLKERTNSTGILKQNT